LKEITAVEEEVYSDEEDKITRKMTRRCEIRTVVIK
jgi:hypothetical protein